MGKAFALAALVACSFAVPACGGSGASIGEAADGGGGDTATGDSAADNACPDRTPAGKWQAMSPAPVMAPNWANQWQPFALWTGKRFVLFSGATDVPAQVTAYDPCADSWTPAVMDPRHDPFGGVQGLVGATFLAFEPDMPQNGMPGTHVKLDTGTMTWSSINTQGGPQSDRDMSASLFLEDRLLVFGGTSPTSVNYNAGYRYDPAGDAWHPTAMATGLVERSGYASAVLGGRLVVWSGAATDGTLLADGFVYDVAADQWRSMSDIGAPAPRVGATAVSTGSELIVWRGSPSTSPTTNQMLTDGAIYNPVSDAWRPMNTTGAPHFFEVFLTTWTGERMLALGIDFPNGKQVSVGGLYDPKADAWTVIDATGSPPTNYQAVAYGAPSGKLLVVPAQNLQGAALYDPVANAWSPIDSNGAPALPALVNVWTGERLISWGQVQQSTTGCPPGGTDGGVCDPAPVYQYTLDGAIYRAP